MVIGLGPGPEFDLIRAFLDQAPAEGPGVRIGPGDDCAVVAGDGIAVTVDMAVEDVHFRRDWLPTSELGYHATAGALSDLAAMAARPIGVLASIALGPGDEAGPGRAVMEGVARAARDADAIVLGGDLTRSPGPLVIDITALGEARSPVRRSGARPGDEVWVTGSLGGSARAVSDWLEGRTPPEWARAAYARPVPRTREALWLAERELPTAMVDLSDGIAGDAGHIAAASDVRLVIRADALPLAGPPAEADERSAQRIRWAAAGGEDYELCFTARPGVVDGVRPAFHEAFGVSLTRVGAVEVGSGAVVVDGEGKPLELEAFQHWRSG